MTDNEKLARWQGPAFGEPPNEYYEKPNYLNDDAAVMSLLDTLVEKGYEVRLQHRGSNVYDWEFYICNQFGSVSNVLFKTTINEAIVDAVLEMIGKGAQHDQTTES